MKKKMFDAGLKLIQGSNKAYKGGNSIGAIKHLRLDCISLSLQCFKD
jgi:hypothetical protein